MQHHSIAWNRAALRVQFSLLLLSHLHRKAGYNPEQPRDKQGRWTPTDSSKKPSEKEPLPEIPAERPVSAQLRNQIVKQLAKWAIKALLVETGMGPVVGTAFLMSDIIEAATWLQEYAPAIQSYLDSPKTLDELQQGALTSRPGYDIHHIVEQTPAEKDGFPRSMIDAPGNLASVPKFKHQEISDWYSTNNEEFGSITPREYLRDKDWNTRTRIGLRALRDHGVLKP